MAQRIDIAIQSNLGNLADPVLAQDAATRAWVLAQPSGVAGIYIDSALGLVGTLASSVAQNSNSLSINGNATARISNGNTFNFAGDTTNIYTVTTAPTYDGNGTRFSFTPLAAANYAAATSVINNTITRTLVADMAAGSNISLPIYTVNNRQVVNVNAIPSAPVSSVQFNNNGQFGGSSNLVWDNTNNNLSATTITAVNLLYAGRGGRNVNYFVLNGSQSGDAIELSAATDSTTSLNVDIAIEAGGTGGNIYLQNNTYISSQGSGIAIIGGSDQAVDPQINASIPARNIVLNGSGTGAIALGTLTNPTPILAANAFTQTSLTPGSNNQVLVSAGENRTPYWSAVPAGGSNTQIQYNNAGSLSGTASLFFDSVNSRVSALAPIDVNNVARLADVQAAVAAGIVPVNPVGAIVNIAQNPLSGTYTNNTGVSTATFQGSGSLVIAGRAVNASEYVLLTNQTAGLQNGSYTYATNNGGYNLVITFSDLAAFPVGDTNVTFTFSNIVGGSANFILGFSPGQTTGQRITQQFFLDSSWSSSFTSNSITLTSNLGSTARWSTAPTLIVTLGPPTWSGSPPNFNTFTTNNTGFLLTRTGIVPAHGNFWVSTATGASNYGVQFLNTTTGTITVGTTAIIYTLFGVAAQVPSLQRVLSVGSTTGPRVPIAFQDNSVAQNTVSVSAPSSVPTSFSLFLPNTPGSSGQSLVTDGLGNLSWASAGGSAIQINGNIVNNANFSTSSTTPTALGVVFSNPSGSIVNAAINSSDVINVADNEIAVNVGAALGFVSLGGTTVSTGFGNQGTTASVATTSYTTVRANLLANSGATPPAGGGSGNWTLPPYPLLLSNISNPTSTQIGTITQISENPTHSFLSFTFTGSQLYFANLGPGSWQLYLNNSQYAFVSLPRAEIIRLAQANTVKSLNGGAGVANLISSDNSITISPTIATGAVTIDLRGSGPVVAGQAVGYNIGVINYANLFYGWGSGTGANPGDQPNESTAQFGTGNAYSSNPRIIKNNAGFGGWQFFPLTTSGYNNVASVTAEVTIDGYQYFRTRLNPTNTFNANTLPFSDMGPVFYKTGGNYANTADNFPGFVNATTAYAPLTPVSPLNQVVYITVYSGVSVTAMTAPVQDPGLSNKWKTTLTLNGTVSAIANDPISFEKVYFGGTDLMRVYGSVTETVTSSNTITMTLETFVGLDTAGNPIPNGYAGQSFTLNFNPVVFPWKVIVLGQQYTNATYVETIIPPNTWTIDSSTLNPNGFSITAAQSQIQYGFAWDFFYPNDVLTIDQTYRTTASNFNNRVTVNLSSGAIGIPYSGNGITGSVTPSSIVIGNNLTGSFNAVTKALTVNASGGSGIPVVNFPSTSGPNQQYPRTELAQYSSADYLTVVAAGGVLDRSNYSLSAIDAQGRKTLTIIPSLVTGAQIQIQPGGGGGSNTTMPASPLNSVQFNNVNVFGGSANMTWDNTNNVLAVSNVNTGSTLNVGTSNSNFVQITGGPLTSDWPTIQASGAVGTTLITLKLQGKGNGGIQLGDVGYICPIYAANGVQNTRMTTGNQGDVLVSNGANGTPFWSAVPLEASYWTLSLPAAESSNGSFMSFGGGGTTTATWTEVFNVLGITLGVGTSGGLTRNTQTFAISSGTYKITVNFQAKTNNSNASDGAFFGLTTSVPNSGSPITFEQNSGPLALLPFQANISASDYVEVSKTEVVALTQTTTFYVWGFANPTGGVNIKANPKISILVEKLI